MEITRAEVLNKDEVIWIVRMCPAEIKTDPDVHALATTLDTLRVKGRL